MAVYLGTAAPAAYYLGSNTVSAMYLGSVQVYSAGGTGGGAAFYSPNTIWTNLAFSGSGIATNKYTKASITSPAADGASIYVTAAGTVRVTASSASCDLDLHIFKNGTAAYTRLDNSSGNGFSGSIPDTGTDSCSITVTAGNLITLGASGDYLNFSNLAIWWTA